MSKPDVWMPLFIGDYLADTGHLSTEEHGAYLLLIMAAWAKGGALADDDAQLARLVRADPKTWRRLRRAIAPFWTIADGLWTHARIASELARASTNSAKAKAKVEGRWGDAGSEERGRALRSQRLAEARAKGTHTAAQWAALVAYHGGACVACGTTKAEIVRDHIQPIYQGGSDAIENIQPLCRSCNAAKGPDARDLRKAGWQGVVNASVQASVEASVMPPNAFPSPSPSPTTPSGECVVPLPDGLLPKTWADWRAHLAKRGKGYTDVAEGYALAQLAKHADPERVVRGALAAGHVTLPPVGGWPSQRERLAAERREPTLAERRVANMEVLTGRKPNAERTIEGAAVELDRGAVHALPSAVREPGSDDVGGRGPDHPAANVG